RRPLKAHMRFWQKRRQDQRSVAPRAIRQQAVRGVGPGNLGNGIQSAPQMFGKSQVRQAWGSLTVEDQGGFDLVPFPEESVDNCQIGRVKAPDAKCWLQQIPTAERMPASI